MTKTPTQNYSFEEYLTYNDDTDNRYELVDGELVMVPLPTADHSDVVDLLSEAIKSAISKQKQTWRIKRDVGVYVGVNPQTGLDRSRTPDLTVFTAEQWAEIKADKTKAAVSKTAPLLAVEIVSPSSKKKDYETKEQEYKAVGVLEYWIVDLRQSKVSVLVLVKGEYQVTEYTGSQQIISPIFSELNLTAQQLLSA